MSSPTETHEIFVFLSSPQFLKYKKAKSFQLTNAQLQSDNGKHKVDIHLSKKDYKKLLVAIKNGKGYRFSEKNIKGGSLWGSFKAGLSKVGSFLKNNVNKEDVKNVINKGVDFVPVSDNVKNVTKSAVNKLVDYGYDDNNRGKSLKDNVFSIANELQPELQNVGEQVGQKALDKIKERFEGQGIIRFKKGSQEAKDHMARIRGLRKAKSTRFIRTGGSVRDNVPMKTRPIKGSQEAKDKMAKIRAMRGKGFFDDIASGLIHTGLPTLGHIAGELLAGSAGGMAGEALGNMAGDAIGQATGRGLKNNNIHTTYGALVDGIPKPLRKRVHVSGGSFLALA